MKTRWIDIDEGDADTPNYRSRLVAKEFNDGAGEGLFASTPPLEALRFLISEAATGRGGEDWEDKVIMVNDVARAFFEAPILRDLCVELPAEAGEGEDMVGHLIMSLYGTRDAAANFQEEVRAFMNKNKADQSKYSPSVYHNKERGLITLVHGDDFITVSNRKNISLFKNKLEGRFEIKTKIIGQGEGENREARVPNQRHVDILIQAMNLSGAKGVKAPGEDEKNWEMSENDQAVDPEEETHFRALAARADYLALDRMDLQYATKEVCRGMAAPTRGHVKKLRRLIRYLIEAPRVVTEYKFQGDVREMEVFLDKNWAGCRRTARSTSGGVMMRGTHHLKSWSSTQKNVTLSSAEAELLAAVKASGEALGMLQLMSSVGVPMTASIMVDSSAALAVVARKGNGNLRHVRVGHLWVQQVAADGGLEYHKVNGEENPSDACTEHSPVNA